MSEKTRKNRVARNIAAVSLACGSVAVAIVVSDIQPNWGQE